MLEIATFEEPNRRTLGKRRVSCKLCAHHHMICCCRKSWNIMIIYKDLSIRFLCVKSYFKQHIGMGWKDVITMRFLFFAGDAGTIW